MIKTINQSATLAEQRWFYFFTTIILAIFWILYLHHFTPLFFPLDDAYIVLHNAQALLLGHDINYPGIPAITGSTSPIHLFLVTLFMLVLTPEHALETISWLAIIFYALGIIRLSFLNQASLLQTTAILWLSLAAGKITFQLLNGVETGLALAGIVWALVWINSKQTSFTRVSGLILLGMLPFLRPELVLFSLLLFIFYIFRQRNISSGKIIIRDTPWVLTGSLPWIIWLWVSTGLPYPITASAKYAFFSKAPFPLSYYLLKGNLLLFNWNIGLPLILMSLLLLLTSIGRIIFVFIILFLLSYGFTQPAVLFHNEQRYLYLLVPFLIYGAISVLRSNNQFIRFLVNILIVSAVVHCSLFFPNNWNHYSEAINNCKNELPSYASWCKYHLPNNAIILVQDAGYLAYASSFHLVDFVGLKTPQSIAYHQQMTLPSLGKERTQAISEILKTSHAKFIIITANWNKAFFITEGLEKQGWKLTPIRTSDLKDGYWVYTINEK